MIKTVFNAAVVAYRRRFCDLPQIAGVVDARNVVKATETLVTAVERNESLGDWGLAKVLGLPTEEGG